MLTDNQKLLIKPFKQKFDTNFKLLFFKNLKGAVYSKSSKPFPHFFSLSDDATERVKEFLERLTKIIVFSMTPQSGRTVPMGKHILVGPYR